MLRNPAFANAVDILGQHDVCVWRTQQRRCYVSEEAKSLSKPLWDSENSTQDFETGWEPLARAMNRHYIDARITGNFNWSLVGSYYGTFPAPGTGLLLAERPWSGWFRVGKSVWVDAHTTQFTKLGWHYLDAACGYTPGNASYVTLRSPDNEHLTIVIETLDLENPELLEIAVNDALPLKALSLWKTNLRSENDAEHFVNVGPVKLQSRQIRLRLEPGCLYTLSTTTGQGKGKAPVTAKAGDQLPLPFTEDFENAGEFRLAKYFSDVHGAFEITASGGGRTGKSYRQMVGREPILWHNATMAPTTMIGDPLWWGDYEVSVDALLEGPGYVELAGRIEAQQHNVSGYHLRITDAGLWKLYSQTRPLPTLYPYPEGEKFQDRPLASGTIGALGINTWHRLILRFEGDEITTLVDGVELARVRNDWHSRGQAGLRVSAWQHAQFDNFSIVKTRPRPEFIPHDEMIAAASSEQAQNDFGSLHLARYAIDDRIETSWRSAYAPPAAFPQSITLDLGKVRDVSMLVCRLPSAENLARAIKDYRVWGSNDGKGFDLLASGTWESGTATRTANWPATRTRYVRLEALTGDPLLGVAIGELDIR
jgi:hypothetical protein